MLEQSAKLCRPVNIDDTVLLPVEDSNKTKSLQNVDVKDNAQKNIVNARGTISVAISSVHAVVEKDARTEIPNLSLRLIHLFNIFIVQK